MNRFSRLGVAALLCGWGVWQMACSQAAESPPRAACVVLADQRTAEPVTAIAAEYQRRTDVSVTVQAVAAADLEVRLKNKTCEADVVVGMDTKDGEATAVGKLPGAHTVAWKYPSGEAVWAAPLNSKPDAASIAKFLGGGTGHILWSESAAGFTIVGGPHHADAYQWVVEHRTAHTYAITAVRMLRECGGIGTGICLDIGCGSGRLDVELAKRSQLKIVGLDIAEDIQPFFEKTVRDAGFADRITFRQGDAQELPFPDDYADLIVSRGVLPFIPDLGKCLREVDRVLKPTGRGDPRRALRVHASGTQAHDRGTPEDRRRNRHCRGERGGRTRSVGEDCRTAGPRSGTHVRWRRRTCWPDASWPTMRSWPARLC